VIVTVERYMWNGKAMMSLDVCSSQVRKGGRTPLYNPIMITGCPNVTDVVLPVRRRLGESEASWQGFGDEKVPQDFWDAMSGPEPGSPGSWFKGFGGERRRRRRLQESSKLRRRELAPVVVVDHVECDLLKTPFKENCNIDMTVVTDPTDQAAMAIASANDVDRYYRALKRVGFVDTFLIADIFVGTGCKNSQVGVEKFSQLQDTCKTHIWLASNNTVDVINSCDSALGASFETFTSGNGTCTSEAVPTSFTCIDDVTSDLSYMLCCVSHLDLYGSNCGVK